MNASVCLGSPPALNGSYFVRQLYAINDFTEDNSNNSLLTQCFLQGFGKMPFIRLREIFYTYVLFQNSVHTDPMK